MDSAIFIAKAADAVKLLMDNGHPLTEKVQAFFWSQG